MITVSDILAAEVTIDADQPTASFQLFAADGAFTAYMDVTSPTIIVTGGIGIVIVQCDRISDINKFFTS